VEHGAHGGDGFLGAVQVGVLSDVVGGDAAGVGSRSRSFQGPVETRSMAVRWRGSDEMPPASVADVACVVTGPQGTTIAQPEPRGRTRVFWNDV
jgi:hypothetical protein